LHEDQTRGDDEEAEQFKQDEEVSHAGYPVAIVREKENMLTLKSSCVKGQCSTRVVGVVGVAALIWENTVAGDG
jgi:hypothetical protein